MKNIKAFIKNNYHFLLLLFMSGIILCILIRNRFQIDDYRYYRIAICGWKEIFEFLKWHLQNYNGRTLVHFLVILSLKNKITVNIWRVLASVITSLICVITAKITSDNKTDFRLGCAVSVLLMMGTIPHFWSLSIYWQTGWFNYIFPGFLLLALMMLFRKNPKSVWLFPLSFVCGATVEQFGLMTVGFFVLALAQYIYENRKFNPRIFAEIALASLGYATVIFSPGTFSRASDQGSLSLNDIVVNVITIVRRRWLDNLSLFLLILSINFFIVYWLIKFKGKNRFTSGVNIPLGAAVSVGTVCNYGLKAFLLLFKLLGRQVEFSDTVNNCIFVLWMIYAVLFVLSFFYTTWLVYAYNKESLPFTAFVLGIGSQLMMVISKKDFNRTSAAGFFMFMIFVVYSVRFFAGDIKQSENKTVKKFIKPEKIIAVVCVCVCIAQITAGILLMQPDNVDYIGTEQFPFEKMDSEKMKEYTKALEEEKKKYFSDTQNEKFDIKDFTWVKE